MDNIGRRPQLLKINSQLRDGRTTLYYSRAQYAIGLTQQNGHPVIAPIALEKEGIRSSAAARRLQEQGPSGRNYVIGYRPSINPLFPSKFP